MNTQANGQHRLLLIDTCGETAGVAVCEGARILASHDLPRGTASAEILQAIRRLQTQCGWSLGGLNAIGVVHGPGSFTGIRAGLATAKGLCESLSLPLLAVSRLEVLAEAAGLQKGLAALDAGRGQLYLRDAESGREWLSSVEAVIQDHPERNIAVAEPSVAGKLAGLSTIFIPLHASDALSAVLRKLRAGADDVAIVDANYVRDESDIYPTSAQRTKPAETVR